MFPTVLEEPRAEAVAKEKRRTILIIDDDAELADVLACRLRQQQFDTITSDSGKEGLQKAKSERPTLIVLDLRLPDADGFDVCEQLADAPETFGIPVIILSGLERPDILRRCRAAGCHYFLRKPYDPNAMLTLIRQAILDAGSWED